MDMSKLELTIEQQANLAIYKQQMETASEEEVKRLLYEVLRLICIKDNIIRELIKDVNL